jgi:UDP-glucose 4-epimerase
MRDVAHVVHLATVKETPDEVMDVTVKGLFWLLEEARGAERFERFLKASLSFGDDQFGGPRWRELVGDEAADHYEREGTVPVLCDADGEPIKRNFVHVHDLVEAMLVALDHPAAHQETFYVCMDEPVDYRALAEHLAATRGLPSVDVRTTHHSTWLDNTKARFLLGWRPRYDLARLVDEAWVHERASDDPRHVWYPG